MKKLILVDFSWLYNKYYYVATYKVGLNEEAENPEEVLFTMLHQFLRLVEKTQAPCKIILAFDSQTSSLKNFQLFEGYKQNRNKEEKKSVYAPLKGVARKLHKILNPKVFYFMRKESYEADQLLAYMVKKYHKKYEIILYSGDKDLLQLTSYPNTFVSEKFEKGKFLIKTDKEIFEKFKDNKGVDFTRISTNKRDILKYRSLKGDPSDNLSPVFPRIKDKEIMSIIQEYWVDNQEENLSEERINDIIEDIRGDNELLANKLEGSKEIWLRNYKIMDLLHVDDINMKRLK